MPKAGGNDQRGRRIRGAYHTRNKSIGGIVMDLERGQMTVQGIPQFYSGTGSPSEGGTVL